MAKRNAEDWPAVAFGWSLLLVAAGVTAYQALGWLQYGTWPSIDLRNLSDPTWTADSGWLGVDKILRWIGRQSVAFVAFIFGAVIVWADCQNRK